MRYKKYGRTFRTRAGKLGRYVYRGGRRVGFEVLRSARSGMRRYIAERTYRYARKRWK